MYCFEFFFLSFYWHIKRIRLYRACDSLLKINIILSNLNLQHRSLGLSFCCKNLLVLSFLFMFILWIKIKPTYLPKNLPTYKSESLTIFWTSFEPNFCIDKLYGLVLFWCLCWYAKSCLTQSFLQKSFRLRSLI